MNKKLQCKIAINFLISCICFWFSKEPSHLDDSFEYPEHRFWFRNKKIIFLLKACISLEQFHNRLQIFTIHLSLAD